MKKIVTALLDDLSSEAKMNERKRKNYNFHKDDSDPVQRMLNALEPSTYVRPHRHVNPDKREVFILLRGRIAVVEFNDKGVVSDLIILDQSIGNYAAEVAPGIWHTVVSLENNSVYYELKDGPYDKNTDKIFSEWSSAEGTQEAVKYLDKLKNKICSV